MKLRTPETRKIYVEQRNKVNKLREKAKQECWVQLGRDLEEDAQGNKKLVYSLAKSYRKERSETQTTIKDQDGNLLVNNADIEARWKQYFEKLLNIEDIDNPAGSTHSTHTQMSKVKRTQTQKRISAWKK